MARERVRLAAAAAALTLLLGACGGGEPTEFSGDTLTNPWQVDATPLVDSHGQPYSLVDDTDRRLTLVFFGYTNCPDICGQVMATLAGTMTRLDDEQLDQLDVVFVTTDPPRDTEEVVGRYVGQFDDSFIGLTGEMADIITVAKSMKVAVDKGDKLPSGGYDVTHGTRIMAVDSADTVPVMWSESVSQAQLTADITSLLAKD